MKRVLGRLMVLALFLFGPLADGLRAQTLITFDSCYRYIESSWQSLNEGLYNKAISGEIKAYTNDSLASVYSIAELRERGDYYNVIQIQQSDDVYDVIDSVILTPFDPVVGFQGATLHYSSNEMVATNSLCYTLWSYAPRFNLVVAGIELGGVPLFHVSQQALYQFLQSTDDKYYQSLMGQRSRLGDFTNPYFTNDNDWEGVAYDVLSHQLFGSHPYQICAEQSDSVLAWYNLQLLSGIANKHCLNGGKVYKDSKLKKVHDASFSDLDMEIHIQIPNPIEPNDPYELIDTSVVVLFEFGGRFNAEVSRRKDDFIISLIVPDMDGTELGRICYSFKELSKYLLPTDKIVLERMLKHFSG